MMKSGVDGTAPRLIRPPLCLLKETSSTKILISTKEQATPMSASPLIPNSSIVRYFECRVCLQYSAPPYYICPNGHYLCTSCLQNPNVTRCPMCRGAKPAIRNLMMEDIADHVHFPCRYEPMGCDELNLLSQKEDHEDTCLHKVYFCPFRNASDCTWRGSVPALEEHMRAAHRVSVCEDLGNGKTNVVLPEAFIASRVSPVTYLLKFDGLLFVAMAHCLSVSTGGRRVLPRKMSHYSVTVQLAGPKFSAELYGYKVSCGNDNYRQTFEGATTSIDIDVDDLLHDDRCLHIPVKAIVHVADDNNALPLTIDIVRRG
ncbi:ubiquitin ligase SIAH1 [Aphelenchoides avenae]|nr:ubiquitin ligase SIAH1 [Aphelenchus avenae]